MRNIGIQREVKRSLDDKYRQNDTGDRIVDLAFVEDSNHEDMEGSVGILTKNGYAYFVDHDDTVLWEVNLNTFLSIEDTSSSSNNTMMVESNSWFNLTYVEPNFIALHHSGAIIAIQSIDGTAELVGEFENGIRAASWNFERSVLVLVTSVIHEEVGEENHSDDAAEQVPEVNVTTDTEVPQRQSVLISLNTEWDVLAEVRIDRIDDQHPVSLCWTETQFAINAVDAADQIRKVRIYRGDTLELHAIGRTEDGSGKLAPNVQYSPMAWAGAGCDWAGRSCAIWCRATSA